MRKPHNNRKIFPVVVLYIPEIFADIKAEKPPLLFPGKAAGGENAGETAGSPEEEKRSKKDRKRVTKTDAAKQNKFVLMSADLRAKTGELRTVGAGQRSVRFLEKADRRKSWHKICLYI